MLYKVFAVLCCLMLFVPSLLAQDTMPTADYVVEGQFIADFQWLPDGTGLRVIDAGFSNESISDFQYDLATQTKEPSSKLLMVKQFDQLNTLSPTKPTSSKIVFLSPDRQWAAYGVMENDQQYLAINHLASGQIHTIYEAHVFNIDSPGLFKARWSQNSSAFYVFSLSGPNTYMYYVSNFNHIFEDISVVRLDCYSCQSLFNEAVGPVSAIFNIDLQGQIILLGRIHRTQSPPSVGTQLVALNMKTLIYNVVIEQTKDLTAASFGPNGEIYYIDLQGMHVYNLQDDTSRLLNANINSSWIGDVEISPDGRYVAATQGDGNLYIIPVAPH